MTSGAFATAAGPHAGDSSKIHRIGTPVVSVTVHAAITGVFSCTFLFILGYEEPTLRDTYGEQYTAFCAAVPRWLPRPVPWRGVF